MVNTVMNMPESKPRQDPTRRAFLGGAAGVAVTAVLPPSRVRSARAVGTGLAGATVKPAAYGQTNALTAARIANNLIGLPLATTFQKLYRPEGVLGTKPTGEMKQLASAGCQFILSVKPSRTLSSGQQSALAAFLAALNQAGIVYRVVLWSEMDDQAFTSQQQWQAYWSFYAPVVTAAGVLCGYDPGCNLNALPKAVAWFPSNPAPDELWIDYYATAFESGARIDALIAEAQAAGVHAGLAEWGWEGNLLANQMTMPWWNAYCNYLIHLAEGGKLPLGASYYDSVRLGIRSNIIDSSSDPRIPGIRNVCSAVQAAA
jgi:hypothetical protein